MKTVPSHFHSAHLSLFQSAIREVGLGSEKSTDAGLHRHNPHLKALEDGPDKLAESVVGQCAHLTLKLIEAKLRRDQEKVTALENQLKFSSCDVAGWAKVVDCYFKYYRGGAIPMYRSYPQDQIDTFGVV